MTPQSLSPTDRQRLRAQRPDAAEREPCWLEGCPCEGAHNEVHFKHQFAAQADGRFGPPPPKPLPPDLCVAIADLLGYPPVPQGVRMRQISTGELDWCEGASEQDWRETLARIARCEPARNPADNSVKEGYVRAVLASVRSDRGGE